MALTTGITVFVTVFIFVAVVSGVVLGLVFGLKKDDDAGGPTATGGGIFVPPPPSAPDRTTPSELGIHPSADALVPNVTVVDSRSSDDAKVLLLASTFDPDLSYPVQNRFGGCMAASRDGTTIVTVVKNLYTGEVPLREKQDDENSANIVEANSEYTIRVSPDSTTEYRCNNAVVFYRQASADNWQPIQNGNLGDVNFATRAPPLLDIASGDLWGDTIAMSTRSRYAAIRLRKGSSQNGDVHFYMDNVATGQYMVDTFQTGGEVTTGTLNQLPRDRQGGVTNDNFGKSVQFITDTEVLIASDKVVASSGGTSKSGAVYLYRENENGAQFSTQDNRRVTPWFLEEWHVTTPENQDDQSLSFGDAFGADANVRVLAVSDNDKKRVYIYTRSAKTKKRPELSQTIDIKHNDAHDVLTVRSIKVTDPPDFIMIGVEDADENQVRVMHRSAPDKDFVEIQRLHAPWTMATRGDKVLGFAHYMDISGDGRILAAGCQYGSAQVPTDVTEGGGDTSLDQVQNSMCLYRMDNKPRGDAVANSYIHRTHADPQCIPGATGSGTNFMLNYSRVLQTVTVTRPDPSNDRILFYSSDQTTTT